MSSNAVPERGQRRGLLLVISSPSGAGKSTLCRELLMAEPDVRMSVSATTRPPREGEIDGEHYHFLAKPQFEDMLDDEAFLEWARVFDNYYGTPRAPVEAWIEEGLDVLFDVDWQGARTLKGADLGEIVSVFVLPPSLRELRQRLIARAADAPDVIRRRMERAMGEIEHWDEYDYVIVNDLVSTSVAQLRAILHAERLKRIRQPWLEGFVQGLEA